MMKTVTIFEKNKKPKSALVDESSLDLTLEFEGGPNKIRLPIESFWGGGDLCHFCRYPGVTQADVEHYFRQLGKPEFSALINTSLDEIQAFNGNVLQDKAEIAFKELSRKELEIYQQAVEKEFGEFSEENLQQCQIRRIGNLKQLMHGNNVLCEIYPLEQRTFLGSSASNRITIDLKYRIF